MPRPFIIGGCNGAGKATASKTILPEILECKEFINADEIACALSPGNPEAVAMCAGSSVVQKTQAIGLKNVAGWGDLK